MYFCVLQDISKELNKCRETGETRLDLSKSQVQHAMSTFIHRQTSIP